ncbi:MAG TPA: hypothetical protein VHC63_15295 [Acidimicrobiales bacterium]|nr:hypothetical protein [Acidimicrobiales bacterium]
MAGRHRGPQRRSHHILAIAAIGLGAVVCSLIAIQTVTETRHRPRIPLQWGFDGTPGWLVPRVAGIALPCGVFVVGSLIGGYLVWKHEHERLAVGITLVVDASAALTNWYQAHQPGTMSSVVLTTAMVALGVVWLVIDRSMHHRAPT